MVDRDLKKPFIIPKTHSSNKDILTSEKPDSRNVIELFNDIKSYALEGQFNFRQNECKSCDTIRNQKLQKSYNERRIQMKKDQDPIERFAFHLITSRDIALNIATDGLICEQLSFSIDKYLGNPKDGIHLSRRPDVLLASSGAHKFGLLVCKVLLGKGYSTIPSINNKELAAQLHYDHHFCKIQSLNKEQRHIDDLLAKSLIFCYEHDDFQTLSRPSQILPLAILWYDLKDKFSTELTSTSQESLQRNSKNIKLTHSHKTKPLTKPIIKPSPSLNNGTWDDLTQMSTPTKYPSQFMLPYPPIYTSFNNSYRDPRLTRPVLPSETIPLSPLERSQSDPSLTLNSITNEQTLPSKDIPLNSTIPLIDPRLKTLKQTKNIFYLESKATKHALQKQKRLNNYYDSKHSSISKTSYSLIPFFIRSILPTNKSSPKNYSSLFISVVDCFHFGFTKSHHNQLVIDLDQDENHLAYEQMNISNQLIQHEEKLNSQKIRLHLREKRQRKMEENFHEQRKIESHNSKIYVNNGRKFLKDHQEITSTSNNQISVELLDFFSNEYRQEDRPHVKRLLAELFGVFVEKYGLEHKQTISNNIEDKTIENSTIPNLPINSVIDMELESPSSQGLGDYDERFRVRTPPPAIIQSIYIQTLPDELNNNNTQLELPSSKSNLLTDDVTLKKNLEQTECLSNEDDNRKLTITNDSIQMTILNSSIEIEDDSNRSRDEFVKLLSKEAYISKSPSPSNISNQRPRSYDNDELNLSSTRTVTVIENKHENDLVIKITNFDKQKDETEKEEPIIKRTKIDSIPPASNDDLNFLVTNTYHQDLDERGQQLERNNNSTPKKYKTKSSSYQQRSNNYERNRVSDNSHHYHQRNMNNSISPSRRHQRFNYNHHSVAEHPRFANVNTTPSPVKNFNYNSFGTSNFSPSMTDYHDTSSITLTNRNLNSSYYNEPPPSNHQYYQDSFSNNLAPLMSTTPEMNFSNSYDSKPSNTIERLQMILQNRTSTSYDHPMNLPSNNNHSQWSSSRYSSGPTSDTIMQNNQTFTYNDAEQLLTFVQHLRN